MWKKAKEFQKTLVERVSVLRRAPSMLASAWSLAPRLLLTSCALRIVSAVVPIGTLWISKEIVDSIASHKLAFHHVLMLVLAEFTLVGAAELLQRTSNYIDTLLSNRFLHALNIRILEHAEKLPLASFENPAFQDRLERVRAQANSQLGVVFNIVQTLQTVVGLLASLGAVLLLMPWFVAIQALAIVPVVIVEMHFAGVVYRMYRDRTSTRRRLDYLMLLGTSNFSAKEIKVFDIGRHLVEAYRQLSDRFYAEDASLSSRRNRTGAVSETLSSIAYYSCYGWLIFRTMQGYLSIGSLLFLAGNFQRARGHIESLFSTLSHTVDQITYVTDIADFFDANALPQTRPRLRPVPQPIQQGFELRNVSFTYAGAASPCLRNVCMSIHPEEKVALVGENGAGKSTLVKLLLGLYEPTEGTVLLDGVDLREYDPSGVRKMCSIVFQDFVHYDMSLRDNIGFGDICAATNLKNVDLAVLKAGAGSLVNRLPERYDQMLGRRFENGIDLSGGEWQKVALARASMREAQVLVFDEPTSALDARAEQGVFQRFSELTAGKVAVLISHRMATVRMADRILVLEKGFLTEQGSHQELLRTGGEYATLFRMQASSYGELMEPVSPAIDRGY
jgi:ATP-binding cassette, subfamily B, bacterial